MRGLVEVLCCVFKLEIREELIAAPELQQYAQQIASVLLQQAVERIARVREVDLRYFPALNFLLAPSRKGSPRHAVASPCMQMRSECLRLHGIIYGKEDTS